MATHKDKSLAATLELWKQRAAAAGAGTRSRKLPATTPITAKREPMSHLTPDRHPQLDFFVADLLDAAPKDDMASMEHPLFALRAGDKAVRTYERNGYRVQVQPGSFGCATIHDKDIWIYAISQLMAAVNRGREDMSRTVRFTAYDFLVNTNRPTNNLGYKRLSAALRRLSGTRIETNIETNGKRTRDFFGLIDSARIIERDEDERMIAIEVTLPDWLYRAVQAKHVLTISRDYFRLRKPLDRRIYELARKHCGANQTKWRAKIKTLHEKSGSRSKLFKFRAAIKELVELGELPDYRMSYDAESDAVTFYARGERGAKAQFSDVMRTLDIGH